MPKVLRIINRFNIGGPTYNATFLTKFISEDYETLLVGGLPEKMGLKIVAIEPMKFDSYYVSILSENYLNPDKGTISKLINAFINGYKSNTWAKKNNNNYSSLLFILKKK